MSPHCFHSKLNGKYLWKARPNTVCTFLLCRRILGFLASPLAMGELKSNNGCLSRALCGRFTHAHLHTHTHAHLTALLSNTNLRAIIENLTVFVTSFSFALTASRARIFRIFLLHGVCACVCVCHTFSFYLTREVSFLRFPAAAELAP